MKKLLLYMLLIISVCCSKKDSGSSTGNNSAGCGSHNGNTLYKDGNGCYYNDGGYGKVYVEANECTC
jgi:hypothetical protein